MSSTRVRFAPSPTGMMHIGNTRTALFNWLFARNTGGTFVLRIEDTDVVRHMDEALEVIFDGFGWLGMDWDEGPEVGGPYGPYFQSQRAEYYKEHAERLMGESQAYVCTCQESSHQDCRCGEADDRQLREGVAVRFRNPGGTTGYEDMVKGSLTFEDEVFGDFILLKSDGMPTYNFANVVDDHLMKITHVIRGDDHVSNTPRQIMIYRALGYKPPLFAHLPQILGEDGKRLSKRHGAVALTEYRNQGFLPQGMMNYLALLGWSPKGEEELLTPDQLVEKFRLEDVRPSPAMFRLDKLMWINAHHLEMLEPAEKVSLIKGVLEERQLLPEGAGDEWLGEVIEAFGSRLKYAAQILDYGDYFFQDDISIPEDLEFRLESPAVLRALAAVAENLESLEPWTDEAIEEVVRAAAKEHDLKAGEVIHGIRASVSGKAVGPSLFSLVRLVGKERVVSRLRRAVEVRT